MNSISLAILVIDENRIRASIIEAGLREARHDNVTVIDDITGVARTIAAYGSEDNNHEAIFSGLTEPDTHHWHLKGGIRRQWSALGQTILYGEYGDCTDQLSPAALNAGATASEFSRWGFGATQEIDAAAMTLWIGLQ